VFALGASAQKITKSADQINEEIARIKHDTNWESDAASDSANVKIKRLAKQLMLLNEQEHAQEKGQKIDSANTEDMKKGVEYRMKLWEQMEESAVKGEEADVLMAEPVRKEIVEDYQNDDDKTINPAIAAESNILVLDLSMPGIQVLIDQMKSFKSINTLIITGGVNGASVNLYDILERAKNYPLTELYIICFKSFVTSIPENISKFRNLQTLGLFKNNLPSLPTVTGNFSLLKVLYTDYNPMKTLFPTISLFKNLETLGIVKTGITMTEVSELKQILPNCKILTE
jgi:Leucine-rich repeat (LRR) protein